jgi:hypothetical protein
VGFLLHPMTHLVCSFTFILGSFLSSVHWSDLLGLL